MQSTLVVCRLCGEPVAQTPGAGRKRLYCSDDCRAENYRRSEREKYMKSPRHLSAVAAGRDSGTTTNCQNCGKRIAAFRAGRNVTFCSSLECVKIRNRAKSRARYAAVPKVAGECEECSAEFLGPRGKRFCSQSCINKGFSRRRRADGRAADLSALRRAQEKGVKVQRGRRIEVLERDGYICYLCGLPTNRDVAYPHPEYPVIDHVEPLARGGSHEMSNWATTHNRCNARKGDRTVAEYRERFPD